MLISQGDKGTFGSSSLKVCFRITSLRSPSPLWIDYCGNNVTLVPGGTATAQNGSPRPPPLCASIGGFDILMALAARRPARSHWRSRSGNVFRNNCGTASWQPCSAMQTQCVSALMSHGVTKEPT